MYTFRDVVNAVYYFVFGRNVKFAKERSKSKFAQVLILVLNIITKYCQGTDNSRTPLETLYILNK